MHIRCGRWKKDKTYRLFWNLFKLKELHKNYNKLKITVNNNLLQQKPPNAKSYPWELQHNYILQLNFRSEKSISTVGQKLDIFWDRSESIPILQRDRCTSRECSTHVKARHKLHTAKQKNPFLRTYLDTGQFKQIEIKRQMNIYLNTAFRQEACTTFNTTNPLWANLHRYPTRNRNQISRNQINCAV